MNEKKELSDAAKDETPSQQGWRNKMLKQRPRDFLFNQEQITHYRNNYTRTKWIQSQTSTANLVPFLLLI